MLRGGRGNLVPTLQIITLPHLVSHRLGTINCGCWCYLSDFLRTHWRCSKAWHSEFDFSYCLDWSHVASQDHRRHNIPHRDHRDERHFRWSYHLSQDRNHWHSCNTDRRRGGTSEALRYTESPVEGELRGRSDKRSNRQKCWDASPLAVDFGLVIVWIKIKCGILSCDKRWGKGNVSKNKRTKLKVIKANRILPEIQIVVERHDIEHGGRVDHEVEKRSCCCSFISSNARSEIGSGGGYVNDSPTKTYAEVSKAKRGSRDALVKLM